MVVRRMGRLRHLLLLFCGAACAACAGASDWLITRSGQHEFRGEFKGAKLRASGREIAWDEVLVMVRDAPLTIGAPHLLHLTSGEAWAVHAGGLMPGKLKVNGPLSAQAQTLDVKVLRALDFARGLPPPGAEPARTLFRREGEALPGEMLWLDGQKLGLNSRLGAFTLPLDGLCRYVFDNRPEQESPGAKHDEVGLTDGSILHGRTALASDGALELRHSTLGDLTLAWAAVRYVLRRSSGVSFLCEPVASSEPRASASGQVLSARRIDRQPLLNVTPPLGLLDTQGILGARGPAWFQGRCVRGMEMQPVTALCWPLPPKGTTQFRAWCGSADGTQGAVQVRISVEGKTALEKLIAPGQPPEWLVADLPAGKELRLEADFAPSLRFPAAVVLGDIHLVAAGE